VQPKQNKNRKGGYHMGVPCGEVESANTMDTSLLFFFLLLVILFSNCGAFDEDPDSLLFFFLLLVFIFTSFCGVGDVGCR
jgi:hypothetical protein